MESSKDYVITILREKYEYELARKRYFDDILGVPVTILSFLIASMYVVVTDKDFYNSICYINVIKWALITALFISCVCTGICLYRVYFGFNRLYSSFPESEKIVNEDYENLKKYHTDYNAKNAESAIVESLKDYIITWYKDCNTNNTQINDNRGNAYYWARLTIGIALGIGLLLLVFIFVIKTL